MLDYPQAQLSPYSTTYLYIPVHSWKSDLDCKEEVIEHKFAQ